MATKEDIPTSADFMLPALRAIQALGGSAQTRQLVNATVERLSPPADLLEINYPGGNQSIYTDRIQWALLDCKRMGALDHPSRGLRVLTALGQEILAMPEEQAVRRLRDLRRQADAEVRSRRAARATSEGEEADAEPVPEDDDEPAEWRQALLTRLHQMSPTGFERFVLYLLRLFGLELEHTGGTGDEGIDGIGIAPLSSVLSAKVAVQVKRYKPDSAGIGRSEVALFQRDADVNGAERAILVTLGRFTPAARKAAQATTPMIDLVDGDRLCDLVREKEKEAGLQIVPQVIAGFFDRFESSS